MNFLSQLATILPSGFYRLQIFETAVSSEGYMLNDFLGPFSERYVTSLPTNSTFEIPNADVTNFLTVTELMHEAVISLFGSAEESGDLKRDTI
jgi:hypothetical protein